MSISLYTFNDMVEHLADTYDIHREGRLLRNCRRAVLTAYREIPHMMRWKYYDRRYVLATVAPQSTGTIAFDLTGGAFERLITLTGATFPADAAQYRIIIGGNHYDIEDYKTSTTVTLAADSHPSADKAAGTSYLIYKSNYRLPSDFRKIGRIIDVDNQREMGVTDSDTQLSQSIYYYDSPDQPYITSIRADGEFPSELKIIFTPPPDSVREYDIIYEAKAMPLAVEKHIAGTVSITAGSPTVTGSTTAGFTSAMVGSVIRFSANANKLPTSFIGDTDGTTNLFTEQGIVKSVESATSLTLTANATNTLSDVKYMISDVVDIEQDAMMTVFQRRMEAEYERLARLDTRQEAEAAFQRALVLAKESDQRSTTADRSFASIYDPFRDVPTGDIP